jgi:metal-responsive CopG/Arc/MetJ family transcriptional regulator
MSRGGRPQNFSRYKVTIQLDEEQAAQLDRSMISFGLESRSQVVMLALQSWQAAVMENATIHGMVQMAVEQARRNFYGSLGNFLQNQAKEMGLPPPTGRS